MAKKAKKAEATSEGDKLNKSQIIRDYKRQHATAKPKEMAEKLNASYKDKGLTFDPQGISTIFSQARKAAGKVVGTRGRKPGSTAKPKAGSGMAGAVAV